MITEKDKQDAEKYADDKHNPQKWMDNFTFNRVMGEKSAAITAYRTCAESKNSEMCLFAEWIYINRFSFDRGVWQKPFNSSLMKTTEELLTEFLKENT